MPLVSGDNVDKCMSVLENIQQTLILAITFEQLEQPGHIYIIALLDELLKYTKQFTFNPYPRVCKGKGGGDRRNCFLHK